MSNGIFKFVQINMKHLLYSFIVFKYVNLILWKEKYILGRNGLYFWGFGEKSELILRIWGAKEKFFLGAEEFSFRDLGRSMHYFQGSREHRPPPGGLIITRRHRSSLRIEKNKNIMIPNRFLNSHIETGSVQES